MQKVSEANALRKLKAPGQVFRGKSWDAEELKRNPNLAIDYITAPPRMAMYMETSTKIYEIYLKYVAPEDIHVYSVDEVFLDITPYLKCSGLSPRDFVRRIIRDILHSILLGALLAIVVLALFLRSVKPTIVVAVSIPLSVLFALGSGIGGLTVSYYLGSSAGAAISLILAVIFAVTFTMRKVRG